MSYIYVDTRTNIPTLQQIHQKQDDTIDMESTDGYTKIMNIHKEKIAYVILFMYPRFLETLRYIHTLGIIHGKINNAYLFINNHNNCPKLFFDKDSFQENNKINAKVVFKNKIREDIINLTNSFIQL